MAIEIERKFLLAPLNVAEVLKRVNLNYNLLPIEQFYIKTDEDGVERLRRVGDKFIHTVKRGFGLIREEFESEISKEEYLQKREHFQDKLIKKNRYLVEWNSLTLEIDEFLSGLSGLTILEVEFGSRASSDNFVVPDFLLPYFIKEVTAYREFTNGYLSKKLKIPSLDEYQISKIFSAISEKGTLKTSIEIKIPPYQSIEKTVKILFYSLEVTLNSSRQGAVSNGDFDIERVAQLKVAGEKLEAILKEFKPIFKNSYYRKIKRISFSKNFKIENEFLHIDKRELFEDLADKSSLSSSLKSYIKKLNRIDYERGLKTVQSRRFRKEMERLQNFDDYFTKKGRVPTIISLYTLLKRREKDIKKLLSKIYLNPKDRYFHKLRVKLKNFRYIIEIFKSVIKGVDMNSFLTELENVQSSLGKLHDLSVQIELLKGFRDSVSDDKEFIGDVESLIWKLKSLKSEKREGVLTILKEKDLTLGLPSNL